MSEWKFESAESPLTPLVREPYPIQLTTDRAIALLGCIRRIMDAVPETGKAAVVPAYQLATEAIWHPVLAQSAPRPMRRTATNVIDIGREAVEEYKRQQEKRNLSPH